MEHIFTMANLKLKPFLFTPRPNERSLSRALAKTHHACHFAIFHFWQAKIDQFGPFYTILAHFRPLQTILDGHPFKNGGLSKTPS